MFLQAQLGSCLARRPRQCLPGTERETEPGLMCPHMSRPSASPSGDKVALLGRLAAPGPPLVQDPAVLPLKSLDWFLWEGFKEKKKKKVRN